MARFDQQKRKAVDNFYAAATVGDVDEKLIPLLEFINGLPDYYTTSSCAGRTLLIEDRGSKKDCRFLGLWHRQVEASEVEAALKPGKGLVLFKYESPILHIVSRTLEGAAKLIEHSMASGLKRAGVQTVSQGRYMVEVLSTERIEAPVFDGACRLVSEEYVGFLVSLANKKHARSAVKLKRFEEAVKSSLP